MEEDFRARLLASAPLQAKVAGRIDWGLRPKGASLPAVTLTLVSAVPDYTYAGQVRLRSSRVQTDSWGATAAAAITTARLLAAVLEAPAVQGATRFGASFVAMETDGGVEEDADNIPIFRRIIDFTVWHAPAA